MPAIFQHRTLYAQPVSVMRWGSVTGNMRWRSKLTTDHLKRLYCDFNVSKWRSHRRSALFAPIKITVMLLPIWVTTNHGHIRGKDRGRWSVEGEKNSVAVASLVPSSKSSLWMYSWWIVIKDLLIIELELEIMVTKLIHYHFNSVYSINKQYLCALS